MNSTSNTLRCKWLALGFIVLMSLINLICIFNAIFPAYMHESFKNRFIMFFVPSAFTYITILHYRSPKMFLWLIMCVTTVTTSLYFTISSLSRIYRGIGHIDKATYTQDTFNKVAQSEALWTLLLLIFLFAFSIKRKYSLSFIETIKLKWKLFLCVLVGLCFAMFLYFWAEKGLATRRGEVVSPQKWYRVEFYSPCYLSTNNLLMEIPTFIKLYDNRTNRLLYESDIVNERYIDQNNISERQGALLWPDKNDKAPKLRAGIGIEFPLQPEPE